MRSSTAFDLKFLTEPPMGRKELQIGGTSSVAGTNAAFLRRPAAFGAPLWPAGDRPPPRCRCGAGRYPSAPRRPAPAIARAQDAADTSREPAAITRAGTPRA